MLLYPASYRSFAFNSHLAADGTNVEANVHTTVTIDARSIVTGYRDLRDPLHLAQGGTLGRVHKNMTLIRLAGRIEATDAAQPQGLADREREMLAAFDPYLCYLASPTTDGAFAFDFTEATADTTNYPTMRIPLRYYARPVERPSIEERIGENGWRGYALGLVAPDPRCYEQTLGSLSLTPGAPSGAVVNKGNAPSPLRATITMGGAGASNFTISDGSTSFVLTLAGLVNGSVVVANMETSGPFGRGRRVTLNGADYFSAKTSSAATWLAVPVGSTTFTITNTTNVTSCVLAWGHARA